MFSLRNQAFLAHRMRTIWTQACCVFLLLGGAVAVYAQDTPAEESAPASAISAEESALAETGKALFKGNCTSCHAIHERVVGPALKDVHVRREVPWIKRFMKNSQQVIAEGDEYAVALYKEYNETQMTAFDFEEAELDALVAYIKVASLEPPPAAAAAAVAQADGTAAGSGIDPAHLNILWGAIVIVLLLILVTLWVMSALIKQWLIQKQGLTDDDKAFVLEKPSAKKVLASRTTVGFMVFVFAALLLKLLIDGLYGIGIQQGYAPAQPIAFSHKLHAGQYEIDCNYCHTGVRIGKSAHLPSVNICMNCHGEIKRESPEIKKLYAAIDTGRPIEWVRVHNLPDLAYFNHAQHVVVGGVECATCHGAIETMEVVGQHANLTMGWCVNCHRETQINAKDNAYYDKLVALHSEHGGVLTVSEAGGLECSKCHY